jgi:hypothetical protein
MRGFTIAGLVVAVATMTACGQSEQQKQAEEAKKKIEQAQKQAEETARHAQKAADDAANQAGKAAGQGAEQAMQQAGKSLEAFAKGMQGLGATGADGKPIDPVSFKELQTVFVPLSGWEMGKPTGSRMSMPVAYSQAEVTYRKGDASIEATITDSGFNQLLIAPFSMYLTAGFERETTSGYEKSVKLAGNPGWEKWDGDSKHGELAAFVNKRFIVSFTGRHIDDTKVLYQLAQSSDLVKLAGLK